MASSALIQASQAGVIDPCSWQVLDDPITLDCGHTFNGKTLLEHKYLSPNAANTCPGCAVEITTACRNDAMAARVRSFIDTCEHFDADLVSNTQETPTPPEFITRKSNDKDEKAILAIAERLGIVDGVLMATVLDDPIQLGCGHTYNGSTVSRWIASQRGERTCPGCRAPIQSAERAEDVAQKVDLFIKANAPFPKDLKEGKTTDPDQLVDRAIRQVSGVPREGIDGFIDGCMKEICEALDFILPMIFLIIAYTALIIAAVVYDEHTHPRR
ncbi:MAG: hypothetical protein S4CHLAM102_01560 [Chlamydiia bacterium]|nr:hypothetical protein [Chlamydiia bacterium]